MANFTKTTVEKVVSLKRIFLIDLSFLPRRKDHYAVTFR